MSTDIKPGQVWAWKDVVGAKGPHHFRFEIIEAGTDVTYQYRDAAGFDSEQTFAASADVITAYAYRADREPDTTPAPLDPAKALSFEGYKAPITALDPTAVRAGDTVTLTNGETSVRGPVLHIEKALPMDVVLGFSIQNVGWRYLAPGVVAQQEHGVWTLTAHQPAPEPEPDEGPLYSIEGVNPLGGIYAAYSPRAMDEGRDPNPWISLTGTRYARADVTAFRPVVVIDPATVDVDALGEALHQVMVDAPGISSWPNIARAALAELGIEVAR